MPKQNESNTQKINVVEIDFSYYVWPQDTPENLYPSPYDTYRKHCEEKSSHPSLYINCNGSIWDDEQRHFKWIKFSKDGEVFPKLTKSLCSRLYTWEREYKVVEVCSYTIRDTQLVHQETVTVLRQGNEVKLAISNCGLKQVAVLNNCYSVLEQISHKSNTNGKTSKNIKELCLILQLHSVKSPNCTAQSDQSSHTYLILSETYVNVTSSGQCGQRQYPCSDQHCISDEYANDGIYDCPDGSDEVESIFVCQQDTLNHNHQCEMEEASLCLCPYDKYMCEGGQCIIWDQICDGKVDCVGANDELNCPQAHQSVVDSTFICYDGESIPYELVNDFLPDCQHAEDEMHLIQSRWSSIGLSHQAYHIPCVPGHPRCFPLYALCVYDLDKHGNVRYCRNGAHLAQCTYLGCPYKFKCPGSYCIPITRLCNNVNDCPFGDDEHMCDYSRPLICPGMFYCRGGSCVYQLQVCDGEKDCPHGDDENNCDRQIPPAICQAKGKLLRCTVSGQYPEINLYKYRALTITGRVQTLDNLYNTTGLVLLNISGTGFNQLKPFQFKDYSMLHTLDMSFNSIQTLHERTFATLHRLLKIGLLGNKLSKISPMTFQGLTALRYVDLSNMRISEVNWESFNEMTSLVSVDLSGNLLKIIDVSVYTGGTLHSVNVTDNPLEYMYPSLGFDFQITLFSNLSYMCCFQEIFKCCGSLHELSPCLTLISHGVSIVSIVYGLCVIGLNVFTGIKIYQKMSHTQRSKDFGTLVVFAMDGVMGLYLILVGLTKYLTPFGLIQKQYDFRYMTCLFGAWLQLFISLSTNAIKTKQAYDYMKDTGSGQLATESKRIWLQILWFVLIILVPIAFTGFVILIPLPFENRLADVYPICSILLVNQSRGGKVQHVSLAIFLINVLLGIMTIVFIVRVWQLIKSSRKAVEGFGAVIKAGNLTSQLAPGLRMIVRSSVSILANIFGVFIHLLVDASTMGKVAIPVSLILIFNSPFLISPLTYIITFATTYRKSRRKQE